MRSILLGTVLISIAAATLSCTSNEVYVKLTKQSKVYAAEETYEIWGNGQKLANNPIFADNELRVSEFCLASTTNNQYTFKMKDGYGDSWTSGSWVMIEGLYGNRVYKGFLTYGQQEELPISLYYGVMKNDQWKMVTGSVSGTWTEYNYGDSSWTQVTLGSVTESVSGPQYFRKTFSGLSGMAAYEVSMNYRYGIVAYVNGNEIWRDNMPEGAITSSTMAEGSYQNVEYHSIIRPAAEVANSQSVLAIEIHFLTSPGQAYVDFDGFLAIYASSTKTEETEKCYVYPYDVTLTASSGYDANYIFDFNKGNYFSASSSYLPATVTYAINGPRAYVNGIRVWPYSSPSYAPSSYTLQGAATATSSTWTTIITASNLVYESSTFLTKQGYFNAGLFANYRIQISSSSDSTVNAYEMQLVVCASVMPTNIEFDEQQYSFYAKYQQINIAPTLSEFTSCTINPAQPAGLTFDQNTCTLSGIATAAQSSITYTVTSTMNGQQYTGTFQLQVIDCSGTLVNLLRTYKGNAAAEAFTIKDLTSQQAVYTVALNSGQVGGIDWSHVLCLTGTRYEAQLSSSYNYWQANSFLYVNTILADNDYDTITRVRFDNNQGLESAPKFNAQYAIKPQESWYYKMGEVPSNWYGSDTSGWTSGTAGSFPASSNQIQLYKKTFNVASVNDVAGLVISLKYQYGCIIYLNNHEAFRLGFTGDLSTSTYSSVSLTNVNFRQISLPIKTMMIGSTAAVDYITAGSNTIAIALVAAGPAQTTANFDCALRLMDTTASSRGYDTYIDWSSIYGSQSGILDGYYDNYIYYSTCGNNYLEIAFNDNRHEWISSVAIKLYHNQGDQQPRQFVLKAKNEDESEWTTLKTVTGMTWSLVGQRNRIWITNNKSYNKYRFENFATGSTASCNWKISMIELMSDPMTVSVPALTYEATSIFKDIEMAELYPSSDLYTDFTVSPALPTGVNLDPNSGIISGTASTTSTQTYLINAKKFNGEAVTAQLALTVEICTGGRALITCVARADGYPGESTYYLHQGKGTSGTIIRQGALMAANSLNYVDACLNDGLYTYEFKDGFGDGWYVPAGYYFTVDVGEMKFEMGQIANAPSSSSFTTMFSSYLPFQIEYSDWKIYKDTTDVPSDWNAVDFNDASWSAVKANAIGTSQAITVYIRKEMMIPDIADYQVLNVRVKYAGGIAAYVNGRLVARFNLEEGFDSQTESITIHDSTVFSKFHAVLATVRGVTGKNVMAFEVHRPLGQSSAENVIFDATGVFGVNDCSIGVDSVIDITGSPGTSIGELSNFFDLTPVTNGYQPNAAGTYLQWAVENLEGTRFNSFAMENPYSVTNVAFSLYGRSDSEETYLSMFEKSGIEIQQRKRNAWEVPVGIASFKQYKWEMDDAASGNVQVSAFIFQYCKASGTNLCDGIDEYPAVGEGQISPAACPDGYKGYSYRTCTNGQLGEIKNDKCTYKLPARIRYDNDRYVVVMNTQVNILKPTYRNIIQKFYLAENTYLPDGLTLDTTTGAITGVPTVESGLKEFTIYGENPAGVAYTVINLSVRKGECRAEGNFPKTSVGETATYECSQAGSYIGTQKRACTLGAKDGEWQKIQGTCMPVSLIIIIVLVVIVVVAVVVFFVMRATRKTKAVGGVKGKKSTKSTTSKKGAEKKPATKAVKV